MSDMVQIMMSTYNGEKYIDEQIKSLLNQHNVDLRIMIRDDGSTDETVKRISSFANDSSIPISIHQEDNVGVVKSFFSLIQAVSLECDYYAFCDQDDVWESRKLARAIELISSEKEGIPVVYCSATNMVNEQLSHLKNWPERPRRQLSMYNALVENVCVGCTMVMNREAMKLIKENTPKHLGKIIMHDWWIYLCISTFGKVLFDEQSAILYRQHSSNVLGGENVGVISKWRRRFKRFRNGQNYYILSQQAEEYLEIYSDLLDDVRFTDIKEFVDKCRSNVFQRIAYSLTTPFYRQSKMDNLIYKIIFIAGKV